VRDLVTYAFANVFFSTGIVKKNAGFLIERERSGIEFWGILPYVGVSRAKARIASSETSSTVVALAHSVRTSLSRSLPSPHYIGCE